MRVRRHPRALKGILALRDWLLHEYSECGPAFKTTKEWSAG
jgi:hypothetical protein